MPSTTPAPAPYSAPPSSTRQAEVRLSDGSTLVYQVEAGWVVLRDKDRAVAEVFTVTYTATPGQDHASGGARPVTFVFNGGPGAASAYLHLGAVGPQRVAFDADGSTPPPPARLVNNAETWLAFTDLVFVDPVGTGFSRALPDPDASESADERAKRKPGAVEAHERPFYALDRDLDSLCEVVQRTLSRLGRWLSPVFIAGESYGGYRAARLARRLQEDAGVGLSGVALISPALEWMTLHAADYDVQSWVGVLPSMAAAALHHGRSRAFAPGTPLPVALEAAERFATERLAPLLLRGDATPRAEADATLNRLSDLLGLPPAVVAVRGGRVPITTFVRELLRDQRQVLGLYDASMTAPDPFPDREPGAGPDPSLAGISRLFTAGINALLRGELGVACERPYHLLNIQVNTSWSVDVDRHALDPLIGAMDDLRYGMALNPHMGVWLAHGYYDLVTPYYASEMLMACANLDPTLKKNLLIRHFPGGHMFYSWEASRVAFRDTMAALVARSVAAGPALR